MHTRFWLEILKGRNHSEELGVDGKIILEWILGKWWNAVDWFHLAHNRGQWRALVNTVMDLRVPEKAENFLSE
jgi:hypothetical protein